MYFAAHMVFCTTIDVDRDNYNTKDFRDYFLHEGDAILEKQKFFFVWLARAIEELETQGIGENLAEMEYEAPTRYVSVYRNTLSKTFKNYQSGIEMWHESKKPLTKVKFDDRGKIEDYAGPGSLMIDFANEYLGGGLIWGNV